MTPDIADAVPLSRETDEATPGVTGLDSLARRMSAVFENLSDAIIVVDREGEVILRNRASRDITGLTDCRGGNVLKTTNLLTWNLDGSPVSPSEYPAKRLFRGLPVRDEEYIARRRDGSLIRIAVNGTTVSESGKVSLAVVTYRDVTETRRLEEMKEDYLRALSHDFRNLLAVLMGETQLLSEELRAAGLDRACRHATDIVRTGKRMKLMMDDLADSMRLDSGQYALRRARVDLRGLVMDVVAGALALGPSPIRTQIPDSCPEVDIDGPRIERCLLNLVSNALKYSPPGSPVLISLGFDSGRVYLRVADKGSGIDAGDLPHIFERFYRGKTAENVDGLGLGLYVCRVAAEAHGGSITVESCPGEGSTFTLVLPIQ